MKKVAGILVLVVISATNLFAEDKSKTNLAVNSPMKQLQTSFQKAKTPRLSDLPGTWVVIRIINTEKFLTGKEGPDRVDFDEKGIRRKEIAGAPLEWALTFTTATLGDFQDLKLNQNAVFGKASGSYTILDGELVLSDGELHFEAPYGGDSVYEFRCKTIDSMRLICLLEGKEDGHGLEFLKITNKEKPDSHG